jgi:hypothetical protein
MRILAHPGSVAAVSPAFTSFVAFLFIISFFMFYSSQKKSARESGFQRRN